MTDLQNIGRQLAEILKQQNTDYIEAHLEESQFSSISYRGKQLESISKTTSIGGNVRALVKGGWGFVSFNDLTDLQHKVALAVKQASFVGKEISPSIPWARIPPPPLTESPYGDGNAARRIVEVLAAKERRATETQT